MSNFFPFEEAEKILSSNDFQNLYKKSGMPKRDAMLLLKKYAKKYDLYYNDLYYLFEKNVSFYQNSFKKNNPKISKEEALKKQSEAFTNSVKNVVASNEMNNFVLKNINKEFIWLPSSSVEPRDEHQIYYGKKYFMNAPPSGVYPGQLYNCNCGFKLLS